ncbi:MAG TPA: hypothetical protein VEN81_11420, partial [Planctomycetota bacterium]|nr:hypothetical protein [Planctomycetota bacterium]
MRRILISGSLLVVLALGAGTEPLFAQAGGPPKGVDLAELEVLTDRWLVVHIVDGHVVHHGKGQKCTEERAVVSRIDAARAARAETWSIASTDDPSYSAGKSPARVGRKTRGCDFAWLIESWQNGRAVNHSPDHALEHRIYLALPTPLRRGAVYTVACGDLIPGNPSLRVRFDETSSRSEALHVNLVGYPASSPAKYGYLYHWMGDLDPLEVKPLGGRNFRLIEQPSGAVAFSGTVKFRFSKDQPETLHLADSPPHGNFLKADVSECDFSGFSRPGTYVLSVEGVGASFPFRIGEDVYREAFRTAIRG